MRNSDTADGPRPFALMLAGAPDLDLVRGRVASGMVPRPDYLVYLDDRGLKPLTLPGPQPFGGMKKWLCQLLRPAALRAARSAASRHRAILALGEDVGVPLSFVLSLLQSRTPVFIITHGTYFDSTAFTFLMRRMRQRKTIYVLALSQSIRKQVMTRYGWPAERCLVTGNPIDTDFYTAPALTPSDGPLLVVSAGVVRRDYQTLFAAVEPLPVKVKVAANSMWIASDPITAVAPENVEISTPPLGTGLRDLYGQAAIVVVPLCETDYACGYSTIFEGMAMGKPVVATRTIGQSELLRDGETALLVEPGDVEDLRAKILYLVQNPDVAERLGRNGRALVERQLALEVLTRSVQQIMAERS